MSVYKLIIPADVASLFMSVLKHGKVRCDLFVTHKDIHVVADTGVLCFTHDSVIAESCSFVFPISTTTLSMKINSDVVLEWAAETRSDGDVAVINARLVVLGNTIPLPDAGTCEIIPQEIPAFKPIPPALTSVIPHLSKYATDGRYGHSLVFPGVVFTRRSVFATTGSTAACWSDSPLIIDTCDSTIDIVDTFYETMQRYNSEVFDAFSNLYIKCIDSPDAYWEELDFFSDDFMYRTAAEWLHIFKEKFPSVQVFVDAIGHIIHKPQELVPITFPKYLDKLLIQDECQYGFGLRYTDTCLIDSCKIKTPGDIMFFLTSPTYGGKRLSGQLMWYTPVNVNHAKLVKPLDDKMYNLAMSFDDDMLCKIPVSVFQTFLQRAKAPLKLSPSDVQNIVFTNHNGKLGVGTLLDGTITSTATTLPCPKGLDEYVILPAGFADISLPFNVTTVKMLFDEKDANMPVFVLAGHILYCFGRIDSFDNNVRQKPQITFSSEVITAPSVPKFGIVPTPLVHAKR